MLALNPVPEKGGGECGEGGGGEGGGGGGGEGEGGEGDQPGIEPHRALVAVMVPPQV